MSKSILITGANGQLGNAIRRIAVERSDMEFYFTDIEDIDLCDKAQISGFVASRNIGYILNCAAYTAVDRAEDEPELCMRVNRDAVQNVGEVANAHNIKVIHISTDYVFDGSGKRPYREDDKPNPQSVYGKSKLEGEKALLATCPASVVIRTAWLYSEYGNNFLKTMLRLGSERPSINVVNDQIGAPTYAGDLAEAMLRIVESPVFIAGIFHYSNEGVCSWYDFAVRIMQMANLQCVVDPITTAEYPTRAKRPSYSVLSKEKIKQTYGVDVPAWETSLATAIKRL
ncbi:MAG: dTDP-4-dehydrorhamnose reductase [Tannerella sp.]|jgi:dTDP-4-dehydrorhamnose reductase|nr:dTDP-4-dehydrorhamnose reductase [Tannerella sp.]